eukprot:TRINITY_DN6023_c0_g1_i1.p1 TRINITY_DN6023_c0_g1~~TRINITY_DN6023_c0_g1_i1.p1  ORF type:complete len:178 (+),score=56.55 TRINITY_DN6023_c0_g1_i1:52-534(+)
MTTAMEVDATPTPTSNDSNATGESATLDAMLEVRKELGRSKSSRSWKLPTANRASAKNPKARLKSGGSYKLRMEKKRQMDEQRAFFAEMEAAQNDAKRKAREKRQAKEERRKLNVVKSTQYQVLSSTMKVKKMSKKQRKLVMKLSDIESKTRKSNTQNKR